jgi:hypothetical protein
MGDHAREALMIDWQIRVNGHEPDGWDPWRDGCAFDDFDQQAYLLPYFQVGDQIIDEYDGAEFTPADTRRLRTHLVRLREEIENRPVAWTITVSGGDAGRPDTELHVERAPILSVIDRTLAMIDRAIELGGVINFFGD